MVEPFTLRQPRPGDFGWVVSRHGALYAAEYKFNQRFEGLVAEVVAGFVKNFDAERERCWIAEKDGAPVGSAFLVKESDTEAKLRLLIVEPSARGLGVGRRLVGECVDTAGALGYRKMRLWTQSILLAARHLYAQAGFRLVRSEPHKGFGYPLVGEYWEKEL
jgi:GNAT superfamily N-acetyltransferase